MSDFDAGWYSAEQGEARNLLTLADCTNAEDGDDPKEFVRGWNAYVAAQP